MSWAISPAYGSVVLGPVQSATLARVHALTGAGRRPYVTLGRLAGEVGRPVSSVHEALGRLRALGLIGYTVTMGRRGGHRLWRPTLGARSSAGPAGLGRLDAGRHSRAVARISGILRASRDTVPLWDPDPPELDPPASERAGDASPASPDAGTPEGPSFRERLEAHGFRPWWRDEPTDD